MNRLYHKMKSSHTENAKTNQEAAEHDHQESKETNGNPISVNSDRNWERDDDTQELGHLGLLYSREFVNCVVSLWILKIAMRERQNLLVSFT